MPSPTRCLAARDTHDFVESRVFRSSAGERAEGRVGIELEWVTRQSDGGPVPPPAALRSSLPVSLPGSSRVTFEPGGQLELSGPPLDGVAAAIRAMKLDVGRVRHALAPDGVDLVGVGIDPEGVRDRVVHAPRYVAMEQYFDARWPSGRTMMRNTASVQVNLDLGPAGDVDARWRHVHGIAPVLAATFANSPFDATGRPTGWRSTRLAVWSDIDPARTQPAARPGVRAAPAWTRYALDAPVMMIRADDDHQVALTGSTPFAQWLDEGHELGWPTIDDFEYHLTTLFPPVRPRGWFELRVVDALPDEWWPVAVAVTVALADDPEAADVAQRAATPVSTRWSEAARDGCADHATRAAAQACFAAALDALPRVGADHDTIAACEEYHERYTARGRCPADDQSNESSRIPATIA